MSFSQSGPLLKKKWEANPNKISGIILKIITSLKLWAKPNLTQELSQIIKKCKPDIIHFHFGDLAAKFIDYIDTSSIPICISFYGQDYEYIPNNQPNILIKYKRLFKSDAQFVCEGPAGRSILLGLGCKEKNINVLPLGIKINQTQPIKKKKHELKLIQIASFTEKKGHIFTVKAIHKALKECPFITCTLIGDERQKSSFDAVKSYIDNNSLEKSITILPFIDYNDLFDTLRNHHVFIHPSCYSLDKDCEGGAPVVLFNAQNAGLPVISTKHCDIPNFIKTNETGILTEEKDIDGLADAISKFYKMDQTEFFVFSENSIKNAYQNFDLTINAKDYSHFYRSLIGPQ